MTHNKSNVSILSKHIFLKFFLHSLSAFYFLPEGVLKSMLLKSNKFILKAGVSRKENGRVTPA